MGKVVVPRHLYREVLARLEENVGRVEVYEGEAPLPGMQRVIENYRELVLDCSKLKGSVRIENYGILKLKGLSEESVSKIAEIENYGIIRVPKGFAGKVLELVVENYGTVEEYEEGGERGSGGG